MGRQRLLPRRGSPIIATATRLTRLAIARHKLSCLAACREPTHLSGTRRGTLSSTSSGAKIAVADAAAAAHAQPASRRRGGGHRVATRCAG